MTMTVVVSQVWRLARIFVLAFAAQIAGAAAGTPGARLWEQAAIAAAISVAETVYRQGVPVSRPGGVLDRLAQAYKQTLGAPPAGEAPGPSAHVVTGGAHAAVPGPVAGGPTGG